MRSETRRDSFFTSTAWPALAVVSAVVVGGGMVCCFRGQEPSLGFLVALSCTPPSLLFGLVGWYFSRRRVLRLVSAAATMPGWAVLMSLLYAVVFTD